MSTKWPSAPERVGNVRFGSLADITAGSRHVCFTPEKQTFVSALRMSALCHVWTAPGWQVKTSRCVAGRCSHVFGLLARFA